MGRVKCLAQEQNSLTQAGLEPRPLDPESNTLTIGNNMSPTVVSKNGNVHHLQKTVWCSPKITLLSYCI